MYNARKHTVAVALAALAALGLASSAGAVLPPPIGPVVWGGYTQNQLDATYDQNFWDDDPPEASARLALASDAVRAKYGPPARIAYGPSPYEGLDFYPSNAGGKLPVMIYIHGGAWRGGSAQTSAAQAEMFMEAGAHYVALDFVHTLQNGGNLMEMATQVRRAIAYIYTNAKTLKVDTDQIYISGHSSGGHLCGVMMTTDWSSYGMPKKALKGGICSDGMYELYPVSLSARKTYVNFTPQTIEELSALRHMDRLNGPIVIAYGTHESPEFIRQSQDFAAALQAAGKKVTVVVGTGYNHFEFPETMSSPYAPLGRAALELMNLEPNQGKKK